MLKQFFSKFTHLDLIKTILEIQGVPFYAVVVIRIGPNFLFKPILAYCVL